MMITKDKWTMKQEKQNYNCNKHINKNNYDKSSSNKNNEKKDKRTELVNQIGLKRIIKNTLKKSNLINKRK